MPYSPPCDDSDAPPRNHRRTRSIPITFSTDKNPSVFQPLSGIPRRRHSLTSNDQPNTPASPRRAVFSIHPEDDESTTSEDDEELLEEDSDNSKPLSITIDAAVPLPPKDSCIPFPTIESQASPLASTPPLPRVASTPVILPNGKPLKPSLKSSSSPNLPDALLPLHQRSQSAPSTPATPFPKNVHFKDEEDGVLETVRVFNKSGKPASINYGSGAEETETETEFESAPSSSVPITFDGFPFTSSPHSTLVQAPAPLSSQIPNPNPAPYANVFLETVTVPKSRPPVLRGSVLVRNITFTKNVAIRFTFDEWQTTSEVCGTYVTSMPSLPEELKALSAENGGPTNRRNRSATVGWDWASTASQPPAWDRFSFLIKLEDVERKLLHSSMFMAIRYQATGPGGGEWWDNNGGDNYKLSFQHVQLSSTGEEKATSSSFANTSAMFTAMSHSPSFPPSNKAYDKGFSSSTRRPNFPFPVRPAAPVRSHSNPTIPTYTMLGTIGKSKSRLSLANYVAPSNSIGEDDDDDEIEAEKNIGSPSSDLGAELVMSPTCIIGGMPATAPNVELLWPSSFNGDVHEMSSPQSRHSSLSSMTSLTTPTDSPKISPNSSGIFSPTSSNGTDTYAEFVKKWCFHQSPPPVTPASIPRASGTTTPTPANPWIESYNARPTLRVAGFERA